MYEFFLMFLGWVLGGVLSIIKALLQPFVKLAKIYLITTPEQRLFIEMSLFCAFEEAASDLRRRCVIKPGSKAEQKIGGFIVRRSEAYNERYQREIVPLLAARRLAGQS